MCSNPKVFLKLKRKFDRKFLVFGRNSRMIYIGYLSNYVRKVVNGDCKIYPSVFGYPNELYDLVFVPCGQCLTCRLSQASVRAAQGYCEYKTSSGAKFITLTFGDKQTLDYLKNDRKMSDYASKKYAKFLSWSLEKEEFQKFMKRIRYDLYQEELRTFCLKYDFLHKYIFKKIKGHIVPRETVSRLMEQSDASFVKENFKPTSLRYIHCGEYGDKNGRAHHHLILFNTDSIDWNLRLEHHYVQGKLEPVNRSGFLEKYWKFGESSCDDVSYNAINYVCRYVTKKVTGLYAQSYYNGRKPEYISQSNRPGIGKKFFEMFSDSLIRKGSILCKSRKGKFISVPLPRYFRNLYKREHPVEYAVMVDSKLDEIRTRFEKSFESGFIENCKSQHIESMKILKLLHRSYEKFDGDYSSFLNKCDIFGIPRDFVNLYPKEAKDLLSGYSYKDFEKINSDQKVIDARYRFELWRKKILNRSFDHALSLYHKYPGKYSDVYSLQIDLENDIRSMKNPFVVKNKKSQPKILEFPIPTDIVYKGKVYCS